MYITSLVAGLVFFFSFTVTVLLLLRFMYTWFFLSMGRFH